MSYGENSPSVLSKRDWAKKYVVKFQGIKNSDTKTIEGGYLFMRADDGTITGHGTNNARSRKGAIEYHYNQYCERIKKVNAI